jgi:hypothetical protein
MSELIEKDAEQFIQKFLYSSSYLSISQKALDERLHVYRTDKNKHEYLVFLRKLVEHDEATHNCGKPNCGHEQLTATAKLAIDQELELLSSYFSPSANINEFTNSEKVDLNSKIDEALQKLSDLGIGQQVVFEEIEELKEHLNLNKKNWLQLLKGKLMDLVTEKAIEVVTVQMIYATITESIKAGSFALPQ